MYWAVHERALCVQALKASLRHKIEWDACVLNYWRGPPASHILCFKKWLWRGPKAPGTKGLYINPDWTGSMPSDFLTHSGLHCGKTMARSWLPSYQSPTCTRCIGRTTWAWLRFSVAFCSPAKSLTVCGFMENPLVGEVLTSKQNATKICLWANTGNLRALTGSSNVS